MDYNTVRRKLAIATWSSPREGNIYGKIVLNVGQTLRYIEHLRQTSGQKITITHIVGAAAGRVLAAAPDVNGRIVLGKYIPHETADVAFLVSLDDGNNLGKAKVKAVDKLSIVELAAELRKRAENLRQGKDDEFEKSKPLLQALPSWLIRPVVWMSGYVTGSLGLSLPALGLEAFAFGGCIITSVGMFGLDEAFAPPTPFARVPIYMVVTRIKERPSVHDQKVSVQKQLDLMLTVDHRFLDGHQGSKMAHFLRDFIEHPWTMDGLTEPPWEKEAANHPLVLAAS